MTPEAATRLAAWIAKTNPELFDVLAEKAGIVPAPGMSGLFDTVKAIGSTVGSAVKSVGSFLTSPQGLTTLTEAGKIYMQTQAQRTALQLQIEQARAQGAPLPISNVVDPTSGIATPVYTAPDGRQYPVTPQLAAQLQPSAGLQQFLPWILLGGGVLIAILLLRR